jgi:hypothetical protein
MFLFSPGISYTIVFDGIFFKYEYDMIVLIYFNDYNCILIQINPVITSWYPHDISIPARRSKIPGNGQSQSLMLYGDFTQADDGDGPR